MVRRSIDEIFEGRDGVEGLGFLSLWELGWILGHWCFGLVRLWVGYRILEHMTAYCIAKIPIDRSVIHEIPETMHL